MVEWYPNVLVVSTLYPSGPQQTTNIVEFYYPEEMAAFEREYVEAQQAAYLETCVEDDEIALRMDQGRAALLARGDDEVRTLPVTDGGRHAALPRVVPAQPRARGMSGVGASPLVDARSLRAALGHGARSCCSTRASIWPTRRPASAPGRRATCRARTTPISSATCPARSPRPGRASPAAIRCRRAPRSRPPRAAGASALRQRRGRDGSPGRALCGTPVVDAALAGPRAGSGCSMAASTPGSPRGGTLTTEPPHGRRSRPTRCGRARCRPSSADALQRALGRVRLVDARAAERFRGDIEPLDSVAGHIPGAHQSPVQGQPRAADGRFKTARAIGATNSTPCSARRAPREVVHQCGSGVTACHNLLAMEVAGLAGGRLYPGSWSEWSADPRAAGGARRMIAPVARPRLDLTPINERRLRLVHHCHVEREPERPPEGVCHVQTHPRPDRRFRDHAEGGRHRHRPGQGPRARCSTR